jgi:hypothetical protein
MKRTLFLLYLVVIATKTFAAEEEDEKSDKKEDQKDSIGTVIGIDLGTTYSWYALDQLMSDTEKLDFLLNL